jgi:hypothetical protein
MHHDDFFRAAALPPFRPAAFFWAVVPPCFELPPDPDFLPPRAEAPGEFAIRAARSFDMPLPFKASYCFSFFTLGRLSGISALLSSAGFVSIFPCSGRHETVVEDRARGYGGGMPSRTKESRNDSVVTALGESALTGLPGKLGSAVAKPVSERTRWSEQQIRTAIGLALFAWALYRVLRPAIRAMRDR